MAVSSYPNEGMKCIAPELAASEFKVPKEIKVWLKKQKQQMVDAAVYDLIGDYKNVQVEKINN